MPSAMIAVSPIRIVLSIVPVDMLIPSATAFVQKRQPPDGRIHRNTRKTGDSTVILRRNYVTLCDVLDKRVLIPVRPGEGRRSSQGRLL